MKSKRIISLLLSLLMIISLVPMGVFADEAEAPVAEEVIEEIIIEEEPEEPEIEVPAEETPAEEITEVPAEEAEEEVVEETEIITDEAPVLNETDSYGHELVETTVDPALYPQCPHSNRNSGYTTYEFKYPGATKLVVTFAAESYLDGSEYLEITDGNGGYVNYYNYWNSLSGASFTVYSDSFEMSLYSYYYANSYGFEIESIVATAPQHTNSAPGASLDPTCTEDGHEAGYICGICGEDFHGKTIPATGHSFVETVTAPTADEFGYSTFTCHCGESYKGKFRGYGPHYQGDITDTISWIMEDGVLYILGSGAMPDEWPEYRNWTEQEGIKSVIISEGITHIGEGAFIYEYLIESVAIPSTVTSIGETAFYSMKALKSITLPEGLTEIGSSAFSESGITSITIPDSVKTISNYAFANCYDLAEINFGSGVETIELQAFQNCTSLTSVFFPYNIDYIAQSAFRYCSNLQEITFGLPVARGGFGSGLTLGVEAFAYCDLRVVDLPSHTYSIDGGTFASNPKLTAVNVSTTQTLNSIEGPKYLTDSRGCVYEYDMNFDTDEYYPYNLVVVPGALSGSYTVPDCVRTIEAEIRDMPNLTNWAFGAGYGGIWNAYAFVNCPKLIEVKAGGPSSSGDVWYNDSQGALYCKYSGRDTSQLYFVPANATEYTLPADCNRIASEGALTNAPLKNVYVASGNTYFKSVGGVLYSADGTILTYYPCGRTDTKFTIPASVEDVESDAFTGCKYITDLYFEGDFMWMNFDGFKVKTLTIWYPADNDTWNPDMLDALKQEYGIAYGIELIFKPYGGAEEVKITAPANVKATIVASSGKPKITWDKVEGAVKYEVWRATTSTGKGSRMSSPTGTSLTNNSAKAGTKYYYYVLAVDKDGNKSEASKRVNIVCDYAQPVVTITNDAATGKPKLTWNAVDGATSYKIYRATSKTGTYSVMKTQSGTSYINTSATVNKTYYYKVKAYGANSAATSADSAVVSRLCDLKRPTVTLSNVASTGKIKVSWTKVDGAAKYQVQRATSKTGTYSVVKTTTSLSYTDTNTTAGKTYYYKVRAVHSNSNANSAYTAYKSRMCDLKAPVVSITTSSGKPKVSWAAITGAKEYKIYRSTSKTGTYSLVKTTTAKYWKDTTAVKGKTYYYKVVAVHKSSGANSAESTVKSIKCTK